MTLTGQTARQQPQPLHLGRGVSGQCSTDERRRLVCPVLGQPQLSHPRHRIMSHGVSTKELALCSLEIATQ